MEEVGVGFLLQGNCSIKITQYIKKKNLYLALNERLVLLQQEKKFHLLFIIDLCFVIFLSLESEDFTGRVITRRKKGNSELWGQTILGPAPWDH